MKEFLCFMAALAIAACFLGWYSTTAPGPEEQAKAYDKRYAAFIQTLPQGEPQEAETGKEVDIGLPCVVKFEYISRGNIILHAKGERFDVALLPAEAGETRYGTINLGPIFLPYVIQVVELTSKKVRYHISSYQEMLVRTSTPK